MRPECSATVPVSETSRLFWLVKVEPSGCRSPKVTSAHWAETLTLSTKKCECECQGRGKHSELLLIHFAGPFLYSVSADIQRLSSLLIN